MKQIPTFTVCDFNGLAQTHNPKICAILVNNSDLIRKVFAISRQ